MNQQIEIVAKGITRTVGYIDFDTSTYYSRRARKNLLRRFSGFGISTPIIDYLVEKDVFCIEISYRGHVYKSSPIKFILFGYKYNDGNDKQLVLPLSEFENNAPLFSYQPVVKEFIPIDSHQLNLVGSPLC